MRRKYITHLCTSRKLRCTRCGTRIWVKRPLSFLAFRRLDTVLQKARIIVLPSAVLFDLRHTAL